MVWDREWRSWMISRLAYIAFALLLTWAPARAEITGEPRIIDGDTIEVARQHIRLYGIDAPEWKQTCDLEGRPWPCGVAATDALRRFVGDKPVTCREKDVDRYARIIAVCYLGGPGGPDIGAWMVREGWAMAYRHYSLDYVADEDAAKAAHTGIWQGSFEPPWEWRQLMRENRP